MHARSTTSAGLRLRHFRYHAEPAIRLSRTTHRFQSESSLALQADQDLVCSGKNNTRA